MARSTSVSTTASPTTRVDTVRAREILDSRGNPTLAVEVRLAGGAVGRAMVPSGASTGAHEAIELRDGGARFGGKGCLRAKENAEGPLAQAVKGLDAVEVASVDAALRRADGTDNLGRLGANAVLGISLACAKAAAAARGLPFYRFAAEAFGNADLRMPVPMMNVLNGGRHADNGLDVQEFMVAPTGVRSLREAVRAGAEVYQALRRTLTARSLSTAVGDEGGFAPRVRSNGEALDLLAESVATTPWRLGTDVALALDVAASELYRDGAYRFEGRSVSAADLCAVYERWVTRHPIYSIEDGLAEDDWDGWREMTAGLGGRVQLVGDDVFVTNPARLARGMAEGAANAVLVKPNQIGTLTDTFRCVRAAYAGGYGVVMSHRSGETEDTTIADLAVALGTGQIKTGAPCRAERTAKYNRLLLIEEELEAALGGPVPYGPRPPRT